MTDNMTIFQNPAFGVRALTAAINIIPNQYNLWNRLGLFRAKPIRTTHFTVEYKNGFLNLIPSQVRGGPAAKNRTGKRNLRSFTVPHFPLDGAVLADDVQNVRAFGSDDRLQGVQELVNEELSSIRDKHETTKEWLRNGAVHGKILDADGSVMLDLFAEFGVSEEVFGFNFGGTADSIEKTSSDIKRYFRKAAKGETIRNIAVLASPGFMDKLLSDESVLAAYRFFQAAQGQNPNRDDVRDNFTHHGLTYIEFDGQFNYVDEAGNSVEYEYLEDGEARVIPIGTRNVFHEYLAPADFIETVNTLGKAMYAKQQPMKWNRGREIHTQQNVLPFCTRPELLVKATSA